MDVTKLFENIYLHIAEFTKHEHTTIYLDITSIKNTHQIYKTLPTQMLPKNCQIMKELSTYSYNI
jgi:hypothetical protein